MQVLFVLLAFLAFVVGIVFLVLYSIALGKHDKPKQKKQRNVLLITIAVFIVCCIGSGMAGRSEAGGDANHANHAQIVAERKKKAKAKAEAKAKKKAQVKKKSANKSKKAKNLALLNEALGRIPAKTHHLITKAYLGDGNIDVHVVLSDDLLNESDAALRKNCKTAWQSTTNIVEELGPYPDGDIDADEPLIYIEDSSGNELARTNMWGSFKWEG